VCGTEEYQANQGNFYSNNHFGTFFFFFFSFLAFDKKKIVDLWMQGIGCNP
jgi:hypothetical protein